MKPIQVGLLGIGTVGSGTFKVLQRNQHEIQRRAGRGIEIAMVADLDVARARSIVGEGVEVVADARAVIANPAIDIVVELIGGYGIAKTLVLEAIAAGKHVVTANKALLAHHGPELYDEARRRGVTLAFEAAVAGGIPLIRAIKDGLVANRILSVFGIVNGTCNYILTKMTDEGLDFGMVLKEAQAHGYAEADPTFDIEGNDSAHKLQILVTLAFRTFVDLEQIHTEGITRVTAQDIAYASELGYRIKLLAIAKAVANGVEARVHPTMIAAASPLAAVSPSATSCSTGEARARCPPRRRCGRTSSKSRAVPRTTSRRRASSSRQHPRSRCPCSRWTTCARATTSE